RLRESLRFLTIGVLSDLTEAAANGFVNGLDDEFLALAVPHFFVGDHGMKPLSLERELVSEWFARCRVGLGHEIREMLIPWPIAGQVVGNQRAHDTLRPERFLSLSHYFLLPATSRFLDLAGYYPGR